MATRAVLLMVLASACATASRPVSAPPKTDATKRVNGDDAIPDDKAADKAESLAECLTRKGVRLFGASWCVPCHKQLELFGEDSKKLSYTDCQPEGHFGNIPECDALEIEIYPTWRFADGFRAYGVRSLKWLSESSSCPLR